MGFGFKRYLISIEGTNALLCNNGLIGADPLHSITKLKARFTSKKKKTEEDYKTISKIEWYVGLYLDGEHKIELVNDEKLGEKDRIVFTGGKVTQLPGRVIKGSLVEAAKKSRMGPIFKSSVKIELACPFKFDGKSVDPNDLLDTEKVSTRYWDYRPVVINGRSRVMKARPIFPKWSCDFTLTFFSDKVDLDKVLETLALAGEIIGVCDYRPIKGGVYGTYKTVNVKELTNV